MAVKIREEEDLNLEYEVESHSLINNSFPWAINNSKVQWVQLRHVNLTNNMITSLPRELGSLSHLRQLILSNNCLGTCAQPDWSWMSQIAIRSNLRMLDLSNNPLTELPDYIWNLNTLRGLKICHNMVTSLFQRILNLHNLTHLDLSHNRSAYLTGAFVERPLLYNADVSMRLHDKYLPCRLAECVGQTEICLYCAEPCFNYYIRLFKHCKTRMIANVVRHSGNTNVDIKCCYCSRFCYQLSKRVLRDMYCCN